MTQDDLRHRIMRLEAIEAIKHLKGRYCSFCDDRYDPDGIANLFTPDGVWHGESFGRYVGREEIKAYFARISGEIVFAAHLALNPIIDVQDPETASGQWRLIMPATVMTDGEKQARWLVGAYDERYRCVGGTWLFSSLKFRINFFSPHLGSWSETAVP